MVLSSREGKSQEIIFEQRNFRGHAVLNLQDGEDWCREICQVGNRNVSRKGFEMEETALKEVYECVKGLKR